jgi:hypothetical protein
MFTFAFATGIEDSTVNIDTDRRRIDELEKCGFYQHWRTDFAAVKDLGVDFLRYGPPNHRTWLGEGRYDWEFSDLTFGQLKEQNTVHGAGNCPEGAREPSRRRSCDRDIPALYQGRDRSVVFRFVKPVKTGRKQTFGRSSMSHEQSQLTLPSRCGIYRQKYRQNAWTAAGNATLPTRKH